MDREEQVRAIKGDIEEVRNDIVRMVDRFNDICDELLDVTKRLESLTEK